MISQKKLAIAMSAALGGAVVAVAHADSAYFPQVVYSPSVTTIISVVNESAANYTPAGGRGGDNLHYRLYYKDLLAENPNHETCDEVNVYLPTSKYDLQTFDLGDVTTAATPDELGVMFDDPSLNNQWKQANQPFYLGLWPGLSALRGYLVVDNAERSSRNHGGGYQSLKGEAILLEYNTGASWGYQAADRDGSTRENRVSGEFDYGRNGERAGAVSPYQVAVMPITEVDTSFLVTPLYARDQGEAKQEGDKAKFDTDKVIGNVAPTGQNDYEAWVKFTTGRNGSFALYDRDENVVSGAAPQKVVCVGRVEVADLLTAGALNRLRGSGGWGNLANWTTLEQSTNAGPGVSGSITRTEDRAAVIIKHEAGNTMNGLDVGGRWNNAFVIPDRDDKIDRAMPVRDEVLEDS